MKKIVSLILVLVTVLCLFGGCKKEEAPAAPVVIMESEHYTVTLAEFQYYMVTTYDDFASQYGDMINYMLDTSKPLRDQACPVDQSGELTWFDYVADGATETLKNNLLYAEKALAEGVEIAEADKAFLEESMAKLDSLAKEGGYSSTEDYVKARYGEYVTTDTVRACLELSALANTYRNGIYNGASYTDDDYLAYAKANAASCYVADFMYMRMNATITDKMTEEEKAKEWKDTKVLATAFSEAVTDKASFITQSEKYLRSICTIVDSEDKADASKNIFTEEQLKESAKGAETIGVTYSTGTANVDWIFAEGRAAADKTVIFNEEDYTCEIIYMLDPMHLNEAPTVNIRHILISTSEEGDDYKASTKAEEIYEKWKAGEATETSFGVLAAENTADSTSLGKGGLYEDVTPNQFVTELNDWCFDEKRAPGDTEIVKTENGYHIMYFVSKGLPKWKNAADKALRTAALNEHTESIKGEYEITVTEENIAQCPDLFGEE